MLLEIVDWYWENTKHKWEVAKPMLKLSFSLIWRAITHDISKYDWEEAKHFITQSHRLRQSTYMGEDYISGLDAIKDGIDAHYKANPHHPQHYDGGINDMSIVDEIEMIFDWNASCKRHDDGDPFASIEKNKERFSYGEERAEIYRKAIRFSKGN